MSTVGLERRLRLGRPRNGVRVRVRVRNRVRVRVRAREFRGGVRVRVRVRVGVKVRVRVRVILHHDARGGCNSSCIGWVSSLDFHCANRSCS